MRVDNERRAERLGNGGGDGKDVPLVCIGRSVVSGEGREG